MWAVALFRKPTGARPNIFSFLPRGERSGRSCSSVFFPLPLHVGGKGKGFRPEVVPPSIPPRLNGAQASSVLAALARQIPHIPPVLLRGKLN